jgi:hypothetical protein
LKHVIELSRVIRRSPNRFPSLVDTRTQHPVRRALVPGFPSALVFLSFHGRIQILAVCHTRRKPGYWLDRLEFDDD